MRKIFQVLVIIAALPVISMQLDAKRRTELVEIRPSIKHPVSAFAIFTDLQTYAHCSAEIAEFRKVLEKEGLGTYVYAASWRRPEQVRGYIYSVAADMAPLEGVLFLGNVPVVKVQDEYMASEWIVTDRFYDDYNLDFNYFDKDSTDHSYRYTLSARGRQEVFCDIYSGRAGYRAAAEGDWDEIRNIISEWSEAHRCNGRDVSNALRAGTLNKCLCTADCTFGYNLEGDQTAFLNFDNGCDRQDAEDIISVYKMTDNAICRGHNCSSELLDMMRSSGSAAVRKAALGCLAQFADDNYEEAVTACLEDSDAEVREIAARYASVMKISSEEVIRMIEYVLDDQATLETRIAVTKRLGMYSRSDNRHLIADGLSIALSRRFECPRPLREEILKLQRKIR